MRSIIIGAVVTVYISGQKMECDNNLSAWLNYRHISLLYLQKNIQSFLLAQIPVIQL